MAARVMEQERTTPVRVQVALRERRSDVGMSASTFASAVGVHTSSVLRWERRERLPSPAYMQTLAEALEMDVRDAAAYFDVTRQRRSSRLLGHRGQGLRSLQRARGVSVRQIAGALGANPATIHNWESGRVRIPRDDVPVIAGVLRVAVSRVVGALDEFEPRAGSSTPKSRSALRTLRRLRSGCARRYRPACAAGRSTLGSRRSRRRAAHPPQLDWPHTSKSRTSLWSQARHGAHLGERVARATGRRCNATGTAVQPPRRDGACCPPCPPACSVSAATFRMTPGIGASRLESRRKATGSVGSAMQEHPGVGRIAVTVGRSRPLRADARRNHEAIVDPSAIRGHSPLGGATGWSPLAW